MSPQQWNRRWGWRICHQRRFSLHGSCEHWSRWTAAWGRRCWKWWCNAQRDGSGAEHYGHCRCWICARLDGEERRKRGSKRISCCSLFDLLQGNKLLDTSNCKKKQQCVFTCLCVRLYVCFSVWECLHACASVCVCAYVCLCACMLACVWVCACMYVRV